MATLVNDRDLERRLRRYRRRYGLDRWDEVWEGVYVMSPLPNNQHQVFGTRIAAALTVALPPERATVLGGCNVSDRGEGWKKNYRCPDVAVYLAGNPAEDCGTHWRGGPDLAVEIVSPGDRSRKKLPFYAKVGTREVLILDRDPWRLELYRLADGRLAPAGVSTPESDAVLATESVPFTWRLAAADDRPRVEVVSTEDGRRWEV